MSPLLQFRDFPFRVNESSLKGAGSVAQGRSERMQGTSWVQVAPRVLVTGSSGLRGLLSMLT